MLPKKNKRRLGFSVMNATNQVYVIWFTTNLSLRFGLWQVETELWPATNQTNVLPFTVPTLGRDKLFLRAEDWTRVDSNGDGVPDYVEVEYGTDPNNPMTVSNTPDAYNTVYDDVDLDGDGLTGRAERILGTNPLVQDNLALHRFGGQALGDCVS
jgi:hypothetical protein